MQNNRQSISPQETVELCCFDCIKAPRSHPLGKILLNIKNLLEFYSLLTVLFFFPVDATAPVFSVCFLLVFFWRLPNLKKSNAVSSSGGPHKPRSTQFPPVDTQSAFSYNDISVISSFVCSFGPIISTPLFKGQLRKANLRVASHSEPIITQWVWVDSVKGVVYDAP